MRSVDSQALALVQRALGLTGPAEGEAQFEDRILQQTFDVTPVVRRSRTLAQGEGYFTAVLQNNHTGVASTITSSITPYALTSGALDFYPDPVPREFDLWLLAFSAFTQSGSGNFASGDLNVTMAAPNVPRALDESAGVVTPQINLAIFPAEQSAVGGNFLAIGGDVSGGARSYAQPNIRLPRNCTIAFRTLNVGLTSPVYNLTMLWGLFPSMLGQDMALGAR